MKKNTQEEIINDYKEAIRNKYRYEKVEGSYSHYLDNPSQALLRDLCWEIFSSNAKTDDLSIYRKFFRSDFNSKEEDTSTSYTDKFRKVGAFLRGGKESANILTVELAAILVDFEDRPLQKFIRKEKKTEDKIVNSNGMESSEFEESINREKLDTEKSGIDKKEIEKKKDNIATVEKSKSKRFIYRSMSVAMCLLLIFGIIYFSFPKKQCMQWNNDHYDLVDCDLKIEDYPITNKIELLDPGLIDLKKINVCDTTTCFDKNGTAIIWYAKNGEGVDFFNTHGRHPENDKPLRPVTEYILRKYKK